MKPPNLRALERAIIIAIARFNDVLELRRLNKELEVKNYKFQDALDHIQVLRGLLPICANCKKIRDDDHKWHQLEVYLRDHSEVEFSHGI